MLGEKLELKRHPISFPGAHHHVKKYRDVEGLASLAGFGIRIRQGFVDRGFAGGGSRSVGSAVEQEVHEWPTDRANLTDERGRQSVVRNGHLPERTILTGIGPVEVRQPRVRDRRPQDEREEFSSKILPPYLRKTKSLEELIPWLYLKGISTGNFQQALVAPECPGLSANTITRLKSVWQEEYDVWSKRSLTDKEYVYVWADSIDSNVRLESDKVCLLVPIGVTKEGQSLSTTSCMAARTRCTTQSCTLGTGP